MKLKNRIGQRHGRLFVIAEAGRNKRGQAFWQCRCDCGKICYAFGGNLHSGHTRSCGCRKGGIKHGEAGGPKLRRSREYQALVGIIRRCTDPDFPGYHNYGGRGIKVCKEWNSLNKFPAFLAHVGRRPGPGYSIDRWPDKNGDYQPGNVRWATDLQQGANTRKNVHVTFEDTTLHLAEMARRYAISPQKLGYRLRHGWSIEQALRGYSKCT